MEVAMMLDYVYGTDTEELSLRQEAEWRDRVLPELEWDESEESLMVEEVLRRSQPRSHQYA